jgi:hypothetical protein
MEKMQQINVNQTRLLRIIPPYRLRGNPPARDFTLRQRDRGGKEKSPPPRYYPRFLPV